MMSVNYIFYFDIICLRDSASERSVWLGSTHWPDRGGAVMGVQYTPAALSGTANRIFQSFERRHRAEHCIFVRNAAFFRWTGQEEKFF